jgi:hypothetical protein
METLLVNQLVDGWSLDEGRVELNQWAPARGIRHPNER